MTTILQAYHVCRNARENAKILRRVGDRVVIKCWDKLEFAVPEDCQCVVSAVDISMGLSHYTLHITLGWHRQHPSPESSSHRLPQQDAVAG